MIHGNKYLQSALVEAGWGATRKKEGYLKRFYHHLLIRKGSKKALLAVAHKIMIASYHILKNKEPYKEHEVTKINEEKQKQRSVQKNIKELHKLGFMVNITPIN